MSRGVHNCVYYIHAYHASMHPYIKIHQDIKTPPDIKKLMYNTCRPYHTMPYHTVPYHTRPDQTRPLHAYHTSMHTYIKIHQDIKTPPDIKKLMYNTFRPYHTIPYHTRPYHTIPDHTIRLKTSRRQGWPPPPSYRRTEMVDTVRPYHTIPYHTRPDQTRPDQTRPDQTRPYHTTPYHTYDTYHKYHPIPSHTIPYHPIPSHTIPYHPIPSHVSPISAPYHTRTSGQCPHCGYGLPE